MTLVHGEVRHGERRNGQQGGERPGNRRSWATLTDCKEVLVVVHSMVYGQRLHDIYPLLGADLRVHVQFTVAPHAFNGGAAAHVRRLGGTVLPWAEAVRREFDLVLAAGSQGLEQLRGPLVRLPHGAGHIKLSPGQAGVAGATGPAEATGGGSAGERAVGGDPTDGGAAGTEPVGAESGRSARTVAGLGPEYVTWNGQLVPTAYALAHQDDLTELGRGCPEALPIAEVVGDGCYDRIAAALPARERYRAALGLRPDERLVVVCSTWGSGSLFTRLDAVLPRLAAELPRHGYRTALLVHPNVAAQHSPWAVRSWATATSRGAVTVLSPEEDWRPLLVSADFIIGDHGSVTLYGTMTRAPILLAEYPHRDVNPRSPGALLARTAPSLTPAHPLTAQLAYAAEQYRPEEYAAIAARISSEPGRFDRRMRRLLYRVLGLGEPAHAPEPPALPLPPPLSLVSSSGGAGFAGPGEPGGSAGHGGHGGWG
ncbi:hypothetical protein [Streptomyces sp. BE303]|uniref:hypothetical protein n=1 Tax=Streptomyces sp. BE303 TaxID=3002528 RepID=UPI002E7634D4|nr:hypothetical protein [Streptomyces sp. BE303]MED7947881.1 hypothetical protein [Streptomyces sp. BE303]